MRKPVLLIAALLVSVLLYLAVFSVVHRPLTTGGLVEAFRERSAYARSLESPKLVVWAGSNGRYSHRCETLNQVTQLPCANLSIAMGIGLDIQLMAYEPLLFTGDIVYMPMEYGQYRVEEDEMAAGAENAALVHDMRSTLWSLPIQRIARAYGSFDLGYLIHGLVEMTLARAGFDRRAGSTESSNEHGDVVGHTSQLASGYRDFVRGMKYDARPLPLNSHAMRVMERFVERSARRGIRVIAGLPTMPDSAPLDSTFIVRLQAMMERHGQILLLLPNRSRYPLDCFYDTVGHLHEDCQIAHSRAVATRLVLLMSGQKVQE